MAEDLANRCTFGNGERVTRAFGLLPMLDSAQSLLPFRTKLRLWHDLSRPCDVQDEPSLARI